MTRITYYIKAVPEQFDLWKRRNNYWENLLFGKG